MQTKGNNTSHTCNRFKYYTAKNVDHHEHTILQVLNEDLEKRDTCYATSVYFELQKMGHTYSRYLQMNTQKMQDLRACQKQKEYSS